MYLQTDWIMITTSCLLRYYYHIRISNYKQRNVVGKIPKRSMSNMQQNNEYIKVKLNLCMKCTAAFSQIQKFLLKNNLLCLVQNGTPDAMFHMNESLLRVANFSNHVPAYCEALHVGPCQLFNPSLMNWISCTILALKQSWNI